MASFEAQKIVLEFVSVHFEAGLFCAQLMHASTYAHIGYIGVWGQTFIRANPPTMRMGKTTRLNLVVDEELEQKFRRAVFEKYGMKKGNIQKAVEEALQDWMKGQKKKSDG